MWPFLPLAVLISCTTFEPAEPRSDLEQTRDDSAWTALAQEPAKPCSSDPDLFFRRPTRDILQTCISRCQADPGSEACLRVAASRRGGQLDEATEAMVRSALAARCDAGEAQACHLMGEPEHDRELYERACRLGWAESCHRIGGPYGPENTPWMIRACMLGHADGSCEIASRYLTETRQHVEHAQLLCRLAGLGKPGADEQLDDLRSEGLVSDDACGAIGPGPGHGVESPRTADAHVDGEWVVPGNALDGSVPGVASAGGLGIPGVARVSSWVWTRRDDGALRVAAMGEGRLVDAVWNGREWARTIHTAPDDHRARLVFTERGLGWWDRATVRLLDGGSIEVPELASHSRMYPVAKTEPGLQIRPALRVLEGATVTDLPALPGSLEQEGTSISDQVAVRTPGGWLVAWLTDRPAGVERGERGPPEGERILGVAVRSWSGDRWSPILRWEHLPELPKYVNGPIRMPRLSVLLLPDGDAVLMSSRNADHFESWRLRRGSLEPLEVPALPVGSVSGPTLALDADQTPIAAFAFFGSRQHSDPGPSIRAARLVGDRWELMGPRGLVRYTIGNAAALAIRAPEGPDPLLIGWLEGEGHGRHQLVGLTEGEWAALGDPPGPVGIGPDRASAPAVATGGGATFIAWRTDGGGESRVFHLYRAERDQVTPLPQLSTRLGSSWQMAVDDHEQPVLATETHRPRSTWLHRLDGTTWAPPTKRLPPGERHRPIPLAAGEQLWLAAEGQVHAWTGTALTRVGPLPKGAFPKLFRTANGGVGAVVAQQTPAGYRALALRTWDRSGRPVLDEPRACASADEAVLGPPWPQLTARGEQIGWLDEWTQTVRVCLHRDDEWTRLPPLGPTRHGDWALGDADGTPIVWRVLDDRLVAQTWNGRDWEAADPVASCAAGCSNLAGAGRCVAWNTAGANGTEVGFRCLR